jgi:hypothetical protein
MKTKCKKVLIFVTALLIGGAVNMLIVMLSGVVIPLPEGIDPSSMESLVEGMALYEPKHFLMPFLAHALGTLAGAFFAAKWVSSYKKQFALLIGAFFFFGGLMMTFQLPAPFWFEAGDLVLAYFPMGILGWYLATSNARPKS